MMHVKNKKELNRPQFAYMISNKKFPYVFFPGCNAHFCIHWLCNKYRKRDRDVESGSKYVTASWYCPPVSGLSAGHSLHNATYVFRLVYIHFINYWFIIHVDTQTHTLREMKECLQIVFREATQYSIIFIFIFI